jgi:Ribonuclease G/E
MLKEEKFGSNYRKTCFKYHGKTCIVCDEGGAIHVHHVDEDRENNHPENLVPLCPTHHAYMHNENKYRIEEVIKKYLDTWERNWYDMATLVIKRTQNNE